MTHRAQIIYFFTVIRRQQNKIEIDEAQPQPQPQYILRGSPHVGYVHGDDRPLH